LIESFLLYNGDVHLEFDPDRHRYSLVVNENRVKIPSVTSVLGILNKPALIPWAVKETVEILKGAIQPDTAYPSVYLEEVYQHAKRAHREIKKEAADVGTEAHRLIEAYFKGENPVLPAEGTPVRNCFDSALKWVNANGVSFVEHERLVYSRRHRFAGRLDGRALVNGYSAIIDWKSSKNFHPEYVLQTAAYQYAYEEETNDRIQRRYIIRLGKLDGAFEVLERTRTDYIEDRAAFLGALALHKRVKELESGGRICNGCGMWQPTTSFTGSQCKTCCNIRTKLWYAENKDKKRDWDYQTKYGISLSDYESLVALQEGKCALCLESKPLVVDHDHGTGRVRGLLCHYCNRGLGFFKDNQTALLRAANYIKGK